MSTTVRIRYRDGLWTIAPDGAPTVVDGAAGIDVLVLEVAGGHLTWSLLAGHAIPAAVIDDRALAQEWIWAVYGPEVALALDESDGREREYTAEPALPDLAARVWRLGYARWAARWWPASTLDGIAPLDEHLLEDEIAALSEECELIVDGADALIERRGSAETPSRAEDYALAAGPVAAVEPGALVLSRGTAGWDWHRCPPGLLDASERAVSWAVVRTAGTTIVRVSAVAAPLSAVDVPAHLYPRARIRAAGGAADVPLLRDGELWHAETAAPAGSESRVAVEIYVPGVGPDAKEADAADRRARIRALVTARLRRTADAPDNSVDAPLLAEIAAAATDSDF
ncbi:hypothetical protein OHA40_14805 [Nocardia sp. NBC_00508]|uniref:hypothetical protein n=1 Tax=Nocardia sp. NBC_00508 TaxID=2975992 RepID=UPI002E80E24F|nr:hypothetical protein [Nocardia sp. NBC_00508]WUD69279.1 hypothetical protein OHA40_14805 [Nocardia sp. NBC_00508]